MISASCHYGDHNLNEAGTHCKSCGFVNYSMLAYLRWHKDDEPTTTSEGGE